MKRIIRTYLWFLDLSWVSKLCSPKSFDMESFEEEICFSLSGFPNSSVGKEFAYNSGDPGSIPGSGRSAGEGIGYPFHYSWASLVVQLAKNLSSTWVRFLGWENPLKKGTATHTSNVVWRISWTL